MGQAAPVFKRFIGLKRLIARELRGAGAPGGKTVPARVDEAGFTARR